MSEFQNEKISSWGYSYDAEALPALIDATDFSKYTNGKFGTTDTRIGANIKSASEAIRNYCGWHISPSLTCGVVYNVANLHDAFIGGDLLVQLPATFVTSISKIVLDAVLDPDTQEYNGEVITDASCYELDNSNGLLRIYDVGARDRRSRIFVKYVAGLSDAEAIKEITTLRVVHALTNPYGVTSEAAGGVSVAYSSAWIGRANSTSLPSEERETLDAYRVKGVF